MVLPGGDPELGVALLAQVALSPFRFLTEEIQKSIEKLFGSHMTVENRDTLEIFQIIFYILFSCLHILIVK